MSKNKKIKNNNNSLINNKMQKTITTVEIPKQKDSTLKEEKSVELIATLVKNENLIKPKIIIPHIVHAKINYLCNKINNIEWSGTLFYTIEGEFNNNLIIKVKDVLPQNIGTGVATEFDNDDINIPCYMVENNLTNCLQGLIHSHHSMSTFFSGTDQSTLLEEGKDRVHFVSLIINNENSYSAAITVKVEVENIIKQVINTTYNYNTFNLKTITGNSEQSKENTEKKIQVQYVDLDIKFEESEEIFKLDNIISELKEKSKPKAITYMSNYNHNYGYNNFNTPYYKQVDKKENIASKIVEDTDTVKSYIEKYSEVDDNEVFPNIDTSTEDIIVNKELKNAKLGEIVNKEIASEVNDNNDYDEIDIADALSKLSTEELDFLDNFINRAYLILLTGTMYPEQYSNLSETILVKTATTNQTKYYPDETDFANFINGFIEFLLVDSLLSNFSIISITEQFNEDIITSYVVLGIIDKLEPNAILGHNQVIIDNLTRFV